MNIFLRELKAHGKGLIFWSLGMFFLVASGMAKYAGYKQAGQSIVALLAGIPRTVSVVLGFADFDLTTAAGFYGVLFLYVVVMGAVHASLLGANIIAKEERDRTSEFLYARPVSRSTALTGKLLAGLANIVVLNLVTLASSLYLVDYFGEGESASGDILTLMLGLFLLQLIFFSIGALVAGTVKKPRSAASLSTSVMFLTFILSFFIKINESLEFLKYASPFNYFDASAVMKDGLDPVYIALSAVIVLLSIVGTYRFFEMRDLTV